MEQFSASTLFRILKEILFWLLWSWTDWLFQHTGQYLPAYAALFSKLLESSLTRQIITVFTAPHTGLYTEPD
jgi:hypothetical protein